jgi:hypothetical protein
MESHMRSCSVEMWEIIVDGYRKPQDPIVTDARVSGVKSLVSRTQLMHRN